MVFINRKGNCHESCGFFFGVNNWNYTSYNNFYAFFKKNNLSDKYNITSIGKMKLGPKL